MAFKKMTDSELYEKFIDCVNNGVDQTTCGVEIKKIGARALKIKYPNCKSLYFMWYNDDNWTIGTKLYRNRPKAKEKTEPSIKRVEMSDLSVPRDDSIMGRYLNLYDILAIQMEDGGQVTNVIKRIWNYIDYYGSIDLQCLKEILDLNPLFTDTYYFWDDKSAFEAKVFEHKYYLIISAPKCKGVTNNMSDNRR